MNQNFILMNMTEINSLSYFFTKKEAQYELPTS